QSPRLLLWEVLLMPGVSSTECCRSPLYCLLVAKHWRFAYMATMASVGWLTPSASTTRHTAPSPSPSLPSLEDKKVMTSLSAGQQLLKRTATTSEFFSLLTWRTGKKLEWSHLLALA